MKLAKLFATAVLYAYHFGRRATAATNHRPHFDYTIDVRAKSERKSMVKIKITDEQQVVVTLNPVTLKGKPAKLDGKPSWNVVDGESMIEVADDGLSATLVSADTPGVTNVQVSADADLGDGVDTITDTIELTVVDAEASNLGLSVATPTAK